MSNMWADNKTIKTSDLWPSQKVPGKMVVTGFGNMPTYSKVDICDRQKLSGISYELNIIIWNLKTEYKKLEKLNKYINSINPENDDTAELKKLCEVDIKRLTNMLNCIKSELCNCNKCV